MNVFTYIPSSEIHIAADPSHAHAHMYMYGSGDGKALSTGEGVSENRS